MGKFKRQFFFWGALLLVLLAYSFWYNTTLVRYETNNYQIIYTAIYLWGIRPLIYLFSSYLIGSIVCFWIRKNIPNSIARLCMTVGILCVIFYAIVLSGVLPSFVTFFVLSHPVLFIIPGICFAIRTGGLQNV